MPRRKNWLRSDQRAEFAASIRLHRKLHFKLTEYNRARNASSIKSQFSFDLLAHVRKLLSRKKKLNILDSGAGFLGVSADLKTVFGNSVFVTALNVVYLGYPKQVQRRISRQITREKNKGGEFSDLVIEGLQDHRKNLKASAKRALQIDENRVSPIETFSTKRRYDVIMDWIGPLTYSVTPGTTSRVMERYFTLLKPNGILLQAHDYKLDPLIVREFGPKSTIAKRTGYYFVKRKLSERVWGIKKVPLKA